MKSASGCGRGRTTYETFGLIARAEQRIGLGRTTEAAAGLRTAVELADKVGDPALFVRPAAALLPVDGDDALAAEGRAVVNRIASALPDAEMRRRFELVEPVLVISGMRSGRAASSCRPSARSAPSRG